MKYWVLLLTFIGITYSSNSTNIVTFQKKNEEKQIKLYMEELLQSQDIKNIKEVASYQNN